jgi:uncharacterized protein YkwD
MKHTMMIISILFTLLTACTKAAVPSPDPEPSGYTSNVNKSVLLKLVNDTRAKGCKCGDTYYPAAPAVTWNDQLEKAAFAHAADMYEKDYFAHIAPDGSNAGIRIERAGYIWKTYGENIAAGFTTEQSVVEGWILSVSHCKNIMNRSFKEMGVGRAGAVWAQEFASR